MSLLTVGLCVLALGELAYCATIRESLGSDCYTVTAQPVDESGQVIAGSEVTVLQAGVPLSDEQEKFVERAIKLIAEWEVAPGVIAFDGNKLPSETLKKLLERDALCVEAVAVDGLVERRDGENARDVAGWTWREAYDRKLRAGVLEISSGPEDTVHLIPGMFSSRNPSESDLYRLAFLLLHEAAHLQDSDTSERSATEVEVPIYGWHVSQLGLVLGQPAASYSLKEALITSIENSLEYCGEALTLDKSVVLIQRIHAKSEVVSVGATESPPYIYTLREGGGLEAWGVSRKDFQELDVAGALGIQDESHEVQVVVSSDRMVVTVDGASYLTLYPLGKTSSEVDLRKLNYEVPRSQGEGEFYVAPSHDASRTISIVVERGRAVWAATTLGVVFRLDAKSEEVSWAREFPSRSFHSIAVDGRNGPVAVGASGGIAFVVSDLKEPQKDKTIDLRDSFKRRGDVTALAFLPNGVLLGGAADGTLFQYNLASASLSQLIGHSGVIEEIVADPGERWVASRDSNGKVHLWDISTLRVVHSWENIRGGLAALQKGDWLAVGNGTVIDIYDISGVAWGGR